MAESMDLLRDVLQAEVRYQPLFTDLRDRTTPIEAEFGQVFQGWA
jgi:hypothetical protein